MLYFSMLLSCMWDTGNSLARPNRINIASLECQSTLQNVAIRHFDLKCGYTPF